MAYGKIDPRIDVARRDSLDRAIICATSAVEALARRIRTLDDLHQAEMAALRKRLDELEKAAVTP